MSTRLRRRQQEEEQSGNESEESYQFDDNESSGMETTDFSDGDGDEDPKNGSRIKAKKDSIQIYTVGIGDPTGRGSDLDEKTLIEISDMTSASYFRAKDTERLNEIYAELDALEPIEYEEEEYKPTTLLYYYPLGIAIALTIVLSFINSLVSIFKILRNRSQDV